jgi:hypothetical protein
MDKYRKFVVETVALVTEINDRSAPARDGLISVDAKIFGQLVREATNVKAGWQHHLDYKLEERSRKIKETFKTVKPPKRKRVTKKKTEGETTNVEDTGNTNASTK